MSKSTRFRASKTSANSASEDPEQLSKPMPAGPTKETIANIMAFARSYSVRNSRILGKTGFMLN